MRSHSINAQPYVACVVLGILLAILSNGCATKPALQVYQARRTLTHVERHIREQTQRGVVSESAALFADPAIRAARAAIEDADARRLEGDMEVFKADLRMFASIMLRLMHDYAVPPLPPEEPTR